MKISTALERNHRTRFTHFVFDDRGQLDLLAGAVRPCADCGRLIFARWRYEGFDVHEPRTERGQFALGRRPLPDDARAADPDDKRCEDCDPDAWEKPR